MKTVTPHFEHYRLKLYPLSPIHVGSGQFVEPFEYDIELQEGYGILKVYDLDSLLQSLDSRQRAEFNRKADSNFHELRKWLRGQFREEHLRFRIAIASGADQELHQTLDDRNRSGEIELLQRNRLTNQAILPGSAVKGAIRTAVLNAFIQQADAGTKSELRSLAQRVEREHSQGRQLGLEQQFQATALGYAGRRNRYGSDMNYDPFRQLAISDIPITLGETYVDRMQIVKRGAVSDADPGKIQMYREVTQSFAVYQNAEQCFESELRLYPQLAEVPDKEQALSVRFSWQEIAARCNTFYRSRLQQELEEHVTSAGIRERLELAAADIQTNECLIRVGRHSHFECVTVDPVYSVVPRKGYEKSRTYVQGLVPLGWAKLRAEPWETPQP